MAKINCKIKLGQYANIPGFSKYEITKEGLLQEKVKRYVVKNHINRAGYIVYNIKNDNGNWQTIGLHRLLALAFIPNPDNKPCVDHRDGNKLNNSLSNLRWVTYSENNINPNNKKCEHRKPRKDKGDEHKRRTISQYTKTGDFLKNWTVKEASDYYGVRLSTFYRCLNGYCKSVKGFVWKYADEKN